MHYWILTKLSLVVFAIFARLMHKIEAISVAVKRMTGASAETLLGPGLDSLKIEL